MKQINLSPSKLNLFKDCPRCFYDAYTLRTPRPRGIMASLMSGIDRTIKPFADTYAGKMPDFLKEKIEGILMPDRAKIKKWGNWQTGMRYYDTENAIQLYGGLDECVILNNEYIPVDWKTKGQKPKDDGAQYYQLQLDIYNLMLHATGHKIANIGYLVYLYPVWVTHTSELDKLDFTFDVDVYKLDCDIERAKQACIDAVNCLRGARPSMNFNCEYCMLVEKKKQLIDVPEEKKV